MNQPTMTITPTTLSASPVLSENASTPSSTDVNQGNTLSARPIVEPNKLGVMGKNSDNSPGNLSLINREWGNINNPLIQKRQEQKDKLAQSVSANSAKLRDYDNLGNAFGQLGNALSTGLTTGSILSRQFANSNQNAVLAFNRAHSTPTDTINRVEDNFQGIQYSARGGEVGQMKEGDELELTPTQMYLLEKKGYKFQIINK